ncbi:unnamed protein product [Closterium sp. Yama58-4]|nr:unnamed protein product [Closterium sp. Yama58-4]
MCHLEFVFGDRFRSEERLFGPLKAEHVLWIIGILLFYFYVWGRLFGSHSRAHPHPAAQSRTAPQANAHSPPLPGGPPSVAHNKAAASHAKHGAHSHSAGSATAARGDAEARGRSALDAGTLSAGTLGAPPLARHAAGTPPGGGAQGAAVAGAGKAEGAGRARIGGGGADGRKQAAGRAATDGDSAAAGAAAGGKNGKKLWGGGQRGGERGGAGKLGVNSGGGGVGGAKGEAEAWGERVGKRVGEHVGREEEGKEGEEEQAGYEVPYIVQRDPQYVQVREAYGLHLLAQAEAKVARFFAADPFRHKSHGPLLDHSVCGVLSDPCAVHSARSDCLWDGFCAWCSSTDVCVDRASPMAAACSPHLDHRDLSPYQDRILRDAAKYVRVAAGGEMEHHSPAKQKPATANAAVAAATEVESSSSTSSNGSAESPCKIIIPGHFQFLTLDYEEMYWHWLLENFVPLLADMPYARLRDMRTHFILTRSTSTRHLPFLGLLSQSCWRSLEDMQEGTCLVEETKEEQLRFNMDHPSAFASAAARLIDRTAPHFIVDRLNLSHIPAPTKPQVLLVARRRRRLLLNEDALLASTRAMGLPISVAVFEDLPLYEQIRAVRSCAILVGVHGSGLLNSMFLHPGSVLVQIVPYNTTGADRFYEPQVRQAGGSYMEVRVTNRSDSVFHWHLAEDHGSKVGTAEEREQFLQQGPDVQRASDVFFSFWVNQDVHVPVGEYRRVIGEAVAAWEQGRKQQKRQRNEEQQRADWAEEEEEGDAGVAGGGGRGVREGRDGSREQG